MKKSLHLCIFISRMNNRIITFENIKKHIKNARFNQALNSIS